MTVPELILTLVVLIAGLALIGWLGRPKRSKVDLALGRLADDMEEFAIVLGTGLLPAVRSAVEAFESFQRAFEANEVSE